MCIRDSPPALPQRRLLHRDDLSGDGVPGGHVPGAVRHRADAGLAGPVGGEPAGRGAEDQPATSAVGGTRHPALRADGAPRAVRRHPAGTAGGQCRATPSRALTWAPTTVRYLSLIHISEPTRLLSISYAVFCLKK